MEKQRKLSSSAKRGFLCVSTPAVHAAMIDGRKIPVWDKTVRPIVHRTSFCYSPDIGDRYTLVNIDLFTGRSLEAKKALYRALVKNLEPFGIPPDHVKVCLREIPRENWGIRSCGFRIGAWVRS
jgi:phenylpyruvate tautomerase PptA (4-oxalocrotonate tautomerase family)